MYKKIEKDFQSQYGLVKLDNYSFSKPCILGITPSNSNQREINGYLSQFLYLLQIRKYPDVDSNYDIKDLPFDILMREYDSIDKMILNVIPIGNIEESKKIMRNINIISYCDGNSNTGEVLNKIFDGLIKKGYKKEEAKEILKQIFVLQIVDNYYENHHISKLPYATVVTIHDIYDMENSIYEQEEEEKTKFNQNPFIHIELQGRNDRYVLYKSFGEGSLSQTHEEHRFDNDYVHAPIINTVISLYLINMLNMSLNHILISDGNVTIKEDLPRIMDKAMQFINSKNKNYNDFTHNERKELDSYLIKEIRIIFEEKIQVKKLSNEEKSYLNKKDYAIYEFSRGNGNLNICDRLNSLYKLVQEVYNYYDNYSENDVVYIEYTNAGQFEYKKGSAIRIKMRTLLSNIQIFINEINELIVPKDIPIEIHKEIYSFVNDSLNKAKGIIRDDKIQTIINEYCNDNDFKMNL